ncbi:hypothetical protein KAR91_12555 [Candidatus Pacearchaeota archaeon]|nr:hypothetical protein [Candidatus Pacearchaeota archaeon]
MGYLHDDPTCKKEGCKKKVKYGVSQTKVFCSNACRMAHKKVMKDAGMPSVLNVSEEEAVERNTVLKKARKGSKVALLGLYRRWGITAIWNPTKQQMVRI